MRTGKASPPGSEPAGECCEACAAAQAAAHAIVPGATLGATPVATPAATPAPGSAASREAPPPFRGALPVVGLGGGPGSGISRYNDRRIAFGGLAVAMAFVGLAVASTLLPPSIRLGTWLPVHLVLAGAAATAIAAMLPFFMAALVVAPPVRPAFRVAGIALVAVGSLAAMTVYGHARGQAVPAALAGGAFLAGIGLVAFAAVRPLRGALGPRRPQIELAYVVALAYVAVGATIATLLVGGHPAVEAAWGALKPAHAWLNLVGFTGLVIVASLLHLAPTVGGSRLRPRLSGRLAVAGIALGAPVVAAGYATGLDAIARVGGLAVLFGALGVAAHGVAVHLDPERGRWTSDTGWHRTTAGMLLAGQAWLGLGLAVAAVRVLGFGAAPAGWSLPLLVGPLVIGGVAQVLLGAMTHLLPAIGPGDAIRHAAQRRSLGRGAALRLAALNSGAALVSFGFWAEVGSSAGPSGGMLVGLGLAVAVTGIAPTVALLAVAARPGASTRLSAYGAPPSGRG